MSKVYHEVALITEGAEVAFITEGASRYHHGAPGTTFDTIPSYVKVGLFNSIIETAFPNYENIPAVPRIVRCLLAAWKVVTIHSTRRPAYPSPIQSREHGRHQSWRLPSYLSHFITCYAVQMKSPPSPGAQKSPIVAHMAWYLVFASRKACSCQALDNNLRAGASQKGICEKPPLVPGAHTRTG